MEYVIRPIATIHTDFPDKFGIPRQSGLVKELTARIVLEPEYRDPNALTGLTEYSHLRRITPCRCSATRRFWKNCPPKSARGYWAFCAPTRARRTSMTPTACTN